MGLFSSKKITYVSSVAYNMAGDEEERPSYIKSLILQNVMSDTDTSIAATFQSGYIHGPQIDFRSFYRWANLHYSTVGMPAGAINGFQNIDYDLVTTQLPTSVGGEGYIYNIEVIEADYTSWAEQYILENYPTLYDTGWESFSLDNGDILIRFEDLSEVTFTPVGFDKIKDYLYILYVYIDTDDTEPTVAGTTFTLGSGAPWPDTSGWTVVTDTGPSIDQLLNKRVTTHKTYSDATPPETTVVTTTTTEAWVDREAHYYKVEYLGQDPSSIATRMISRRYDMYFMTTSNVTVTTTVDTTSEVIGGVTVTTTVTTEQDVLNVTRTHRTDTTDTVISEWKDKHLWLYEIGSGNTVLDDMIDNPIPVEGEFFPPIPVRLNGRFITEDLDGELYTQSAKAYKKMMKKKFTTLIDKIADNEDIGDIDFAFMTFGVSLNVKENACRKYLYEFFTKLMGFQHYGSASYAAFVIRLTEYNQFIDDYMDFLDGTTTVVPTWKPLPSIKMNEVRIKPDGTANIPYDMLLRWSNIEEHTGTGRGKPGAKTGELWFEILPTQSWDQYIFRGANNEGEVDRLVKMDSKSLQGVRLFWQRSADEFTYLNIYGLGHYNYVYNGKYVFISGNEALEDEDESGFIVPMHYDTMKKMSLVDSTQMTTACCFMLFNCYQIVKQKWYEKGIFKILFVVVFAIVAAVFTGGAGFGLLGTNLAVGSTLGFTGLTAAIVGSVVNALAAVILTTVIDMFARTLFGDTFGALVGAILSFVIFNVAMSFQATGAFSFDWGSLMRAENLLKLTDALSQGYAAYINSANQTLIGKIEDMQTNYEKQSDSISEMWANNIGYSDISFNPGWITNSTQYQYEPSSLFLSRTLMTGTDVANMSLDMITDYSRLNLTLPSVFS